VAEHPAVSGGHRYLKPGWLVSRVINPVLMRLGITPTLAVRGRTSGEWRMVPVNVLELGGQRYLVAPRGNTQWSATCAPPAEASFAGGAGSSPFGLPRSPTTRSRAIIDAYLARWGYQVRPTLGRSRTRPISGVQDRAPVTERRSRGD
jgi:hypothetical protein